MGPKENSSRRLAFLDWTRGLAAVVMLNGHVFNAFIRPDQRGSSPYLLTQFIGGMPPAVFLFLVGVTLAFLMESRERQGMPAGHRVMAGLRRAGYLFGIAFLFRLQLWAFALPGSNWIDLFKVDVLNAMGFAVAVFSVLAVFSTAQRIRLGAILGMAIAFGAPLVSMLNWPGSLWLAKSYLAPSLMMFGFFPWAAFVAFGISAGSILRLTPRERLDPLIQGAALLGLVLIVGARVCSGLPYSLYGRSDYWLNSPWLILIKSGATLLALAAAYLWTQRGVEPGWSWVRQFGITSLLVYWAHTEIVYGRWLWFWKENLTPGETAAASCAVIVCMLGLSMLKAHWKSVRSALLAFGYPFFEPRRVPGD
jgi:uncharacterized membrane protein